MSQNIGTLVTAAIRPNDSLDLIASAFANEIKGGVHSVTASSDRNAIITERREWGMLCYVVNDNKTYQLTYNYADTVITNNSNWKEFSGSGGSGSGEWIDSVIQILTTEPISPSTDARYLIGTDPSDPISGSNWASLSPTAATRVAQWGGTQWTYTTPLNGMTVRVDNQDNALYRYEGDYPTGTWEKEKENQVRYISANLISGASYSATSEPYLNDYDNEILYIVKFNLSNNGTSASLSINGLPHKVIKRTNGQSLSDVITNQLSVNYQYLVTYNGTFFELLDPSVTGGSGLDNKYYISNTETVTVPLNTQYWIYGDLSVDGTLNNYGHVVVANGSLTVAGSFNNSGTYSNIYFAEINGLGQQNYVPRWKTSYMLTATSSIYDNGDQVTISSPTFSATGDVVFSKGASNGYILTSDSNGYATWQKGITKFSATYSFEANATQSISHNLNSSAILFNFWNEITGEPVVVNVRKTGLNTIDVMSTVTVINGRVVIMS